MTPYFETLAEFMAMGGYGFYVWLCWGMVVSSVLFGTVYSRLQRKRLIKQLKLNQQLKQARKKRQSPN